MYARYNLWAIVEVSKQKGHILKIIANIKFSICAFFVSTLVNHAIIQDPKDIPKRKAYYNAIRKSQTNRVVIAEKLLRIGMPGTESTTSY
jgi:hypothetical protein